MSENKVFTVKDVSSHEFVQLYAQHLKKTGKMDVPKWVDLAKTGPFKELAPYDEDYYFIRAASIARKIYLRQGTGVGALRKVYGGRKNRGTKKEHFQKASGGLLRSILINLESMGLVEKHPDGCAEITALNPLHRPSFAACLSRLQELTRGFLTCSGRRITRKGQKDFDLIATSISAPVA
eukprot:SAG31_NODE_2642_length_5323_cov_3.407351_5_plen_180_part_00